MSQYQTDLSNDNTPRMLDLARLDAHELLPNRARDRAHAVWLSGDVYVCAEVSYAVYGADHGGRAYKDAHGVRNIDFIDANRREGERRGKVDEREKRVQVRTCAEELHEVARLSGRLDFFHSDRTLVDDELALGHACQWTLARCVIPSEAEYGVTSNTREDHTVQWRGDELSSCRKRK